MNPSTPPKKPLLRGYLHQEAFFVAFGAGIVMTVQAQDRASMLSSAVYALCLMTLFAVSAIYHRPTWSVKKRAFMKRLDHAAIFLQIAGTFTPICVLALKGEVGQKLLLIIWLTALAGVLQSIFWISAPKWLAALFYVVMGWMIAPYIPELIEVLGTLNVVLLALGGVAYTLGALAYVLKRPNFVTDVFGYHEFFHFLTIVGATLHFAVIMSLI